MDNNQTLQDTVTQVASAQQPNIQPINNSKKKITFILLGVVVLLLLFVLSYFFYFGHDTVQYISKQGGFSVSYPKGWKIVDNSAPGYGSSVSISFSSPDLTYQPNTISAGGFFVISAQKDNLSSIKYLTTHQGQEQYFTPTNLTPTTVDGIAAEKGTNIGSTLSTIVYFLKNGYLWSISYSYPTNQSLTHPEYIKEFNSLISSFKFN